jgi:hypothetical protein
MKTQKDDPVLRHNAQRMAVDHIAQTLRDAGRLRGSQPTATPAIVPHSRRAIGSFVGGAVEKPRLSFFSGKLGGRPITNTDVCFRGKADIEISRRDVCF